MSGESNENRNIKITLPSKGRIITYFGNYTEEWPEIGSTFNETISLGKHTRFYFTIEIIDSD